MTKATARRGGKPAPYTKSRKHPFDYSALYHRHPNLRHWLHNPIPQGYATGGLAASGSDAP